MQIVIDIPEKLYEYAKANLIDSVDEELVIRAIADGTPLLKGHGRLVDADKLIDSYEIADFVGDEYDCVSTACYIVNCAPTIIEADKESK